MLASTPASMLNQKSTALGIHSDSISSQIALDLPRGTVLDRGFHRARHAGAPLAKAHPNASWNGAMTAESPGGARWLGFSGKHHPGAWYAADRCAYPASLLELEQPRAVLGASFAW